MMVEEKSEWETRLRANIDLGFVAAAAAALDNLYFFNHWKKKEKNTKI